MTVQLKAIADLNVSPWEAAMGRIDRAVGRFQSQNLAQLGRAIGGAFSVYAVSNFVKEVGRSADALGDLSAATGVGVENLQALQVLFDKGGKSAEDVNEVLAQLRKSMDEATVTPKIAQSFKTLGIAFEDVARLSPDRILEQIARAMSENAGDMQKGEAAGNLLGRGYATLQGIMQQLAAQGLDPLRESLKATNEIMGEESVRAADKMQEAYDRLGRKMRMTGANVTMGLLGGITGGGGKAQAWGAGIGAGLGAVGAGLLAWGTGGVGLGAAGAMVGGGAALGSAIATALQGRQKTAEALFGKETFDPEAAKRIRAAQKASADAMRAALSAKRDKATAAANEWFREAVSKISVGDVSAADSLARMGGYVGGQASPQTQIAERQLKVAELQKELQQRIAKATEDAAAASKETVSVLSED